MLQMLLKVMPEEKFGLEAFLKFQRKYNVQAEPEFVRTA